MTKAQLFCVNTATTTTTKTTSSSINSENSTMTQKSKIMPHNDFLKRIRKTLYVGGKNPLANDYQYNHHKSKNKNTEHISAPLAQYAAEMFSETHKGHSLNRLNYVTVTNLNSTPCPLILALIYLERLQDSDPMYPRQITPTELFLVSMLVSTKFYCGYDEEVHVNEWTNEHDDITPERLKQIELEFLCALNWNLFVSNQEFFAKLKIIEMELARRQGLQRGWLTYTELTQMLPSFRIAKAFLQYSTLLSVSYAAGVFTLAGAFLLASQIPGPALFQNNNPQQQQQQEPSQQTTQNNKSCPAYSRLPSTQSIVSPSSSSSAASSSSLSTSSSTSSSDISDIDNTDDLLLLSSSTNLNNEILDNLNNLESMNSTTIPTIPYSLLLANQMNYNNNNNESNSIYLNIPNNQPNFYKQYPNFLLTNNYNKDNDGFIATQRDDDNTYHQSNTNTSNEWTVDLVDDYRDNDKDKTCRRTQFITFLISMKIL